MKISISVFLFLLMLLPLDGKNNQSLPNIIFTDISELDQTSHERLINRNKELAKENNTLKKQITLLQSKIEELETKFFLQKAIGKLPNWKETNLAEQNSFILIQEQSIKRLEELSFIVTELENQLVKENIQLKAILRKTAE